MAGSEIEIEKIYCEDCLETMARMPDDFVDLTVTSPPYDNLRKYNGYVFEFEKIAKELYRITKQGGVIVWVVNDSTVNGSETLTSCKQKIFFREECGFNIHDTMIYTWKKPPVKDNRYMQCFEYMFILSKNKPKTFNPILEKKSFKEFGKPIKSNRIRYKCFHRTAENKINKKIINIKDGYRRLYNIWYYVASGGHNTKDKIAYKHPAIFPEQLAEDHIKSWSNENDLVYDPMCGSGTVPKMAIKLNRRWIASEISQQYVDLANKRISDFQRQINLKL